MIKEINNQKFKIIFNAPDEPNALFCEGCNVEYSWEMAEQDPDYFTEIHNWMHYRDTKGKE